MPDNMDSTPWQLRTVPDVFERETYRDRRRHDDEGDGGEASGVREPRRPRPSPPALAAELVDCAS